MTSGDRSTSTLTEARAHGELTRTGQAVVRGGEGGRIHAQLAGARAWLALGTELLQRDVDGAIACADQGLDELGARYKPPGVRESTALKIAAAREQIEAGHPRDAAEILLEALAHRIVMYVQRYDDIVE